jgi:hypothetical protein
MKILIALKTCCRDLDLGFHEAIRATWGKDFAGKADVRFFTGCGEHQSGFGGYQQDETQLDCKDGYDDLPAKTTKIAEWSVQNGYDFTFLCDNDTFIIPHALLGTSFREYDYAGMFGLDPPIGSIFTYRDCHEILHERCEPWASGGVGYWISRHAANIIAAKGVQGWAEDLGVGQVLGPFIRAKVIHAIDLPDLECNASWHVKRFAVFEHKFFPEMIREIYRHGRPEPWYEEVASEEYDVMKMLSKQPKLKMLTNDEARARMESGRKFKEQRKNRR